MTTHMAQQKVCNKILSEDRERHQKSVSLSSKRPGTSFTKTDRAPVQKLIRKRPGTSFTKTDRAPVQKLIRSGQRWAKVVNELGWAGVAFADWMPLAWINTISETKFSKILKGLRSKSVWLRIEASRIFEDDDMKLLFAKPGTILGDPIILISIVKEDNHFNLVSRMGGTLEIGFQNAQGPSDTLPGFVWDDCSCALDAMLLMVLILAEAVGQIRYRKAAEGGSETLVRMTEATLGLAKTPWGNRSLEIMRAHRNSIREEISRRNPSLKFDMQTSLQAFEQHIAPSRLIQFDITMERSCLGFQCRRVWRTPSKKKGMRFDIRREQAYLLKSLQDVLTYIVCLFLWGNAERSDGGRVLERAGNKELPRLWTGKSL